MIDYAKRFCEVCAEANAEENPLRVARLLGQLEIMVEICQENYPLPALCESFKREVELLRQRLMELEERTLPVPSGATLAAPRPKVIYKQEYVLCGKENCRKCAERTGHGPYWYMYQSVNGQSRKRYIGLNLPADLDSDKVVLRYAASSPAGTATLEHPCEFGCESPCDNPRKPCCRLDQPGPPE